MLNILDYAKVFLVHSPEDCHGSCLDGGYCNIVYMSYFDDEQ